MQCHLCGSLLDLEARFCGVCGAPVPQSEALTTQCPLCGAELEADSQFCGCCGAPVVGSAGPAAPPPLFAAETPRRVETPVAAMWAADPPIKESPPEAGLHAGTGSGGGASASRVVLLLVAVVLILGAAGVGSAYAMGWIDWGQRESLPAGSDQAQTGTDGGLTGDNGGMDDTPAASTTSPATSDAVMVAFLEAMETAIYRAGEGKSGIAHLVSVYPGSASESEAAGIAQDVIDNRTDVLNMLAAMNVPSTTAARECHAAFRRAMTYSLRADKEYLAWVHGGPQPGMQPNNYQAGEWKKRFVRKYNTLARAYGFTANWSRKDI